jgi:hypothetical protein
MLLPTNTRGKESQRRRELFFQTDEFAFQNPRGNLLRLDGVIAFRGKTVRPTRFDSRTFHFGVAIAHEKLIHLRLKCHFSLPFLWVDSADGLPKPQRKVSTCLHRQDKKRLKAFSSGTSN